MPVCSLCKKDNDNPADYGEFMKKSEICVHYYCVLLSTHILQKGPDSSGILGFLLRDIRNEIKSCEKRKCHYCKQPFASIACFTCKRYFHNICANQNGCVSEFINEFRSFCHKHVPFKEEKMLTQKNTSTCWICHDPLGKYSPTQTLRAYCCNNGYVHRHCLRKYALAAGYYLVCIWCTSRDFRDDVRKHGVFVPDREATWDNNETLRFTDLHRGYSKCDAKVCLCPQGRDYFRGTWKLIVCCMCGAAGVHDRCGREQISKNNFTCETCNQILMKSKSGKNRRQNDNPALNYTMYMPKAQDDETTGQAHSAHEDESSSACTSKQSKDPQTTKNSLSSGQSSQRKPQIRELFLFGKNSEIIGTVHVDQDKLKQKSDKLVCQEEDILEFSSSNKLLDAVLSDILAEGRELTIDMVDEVFDRFKLSLENFGDSDLDSTRDC